MQRTLPAIKPLSIWTYVISLALWLSLCIGAMAFVVIKNIRDVENDVSQYGDAYSDHLNKEMVSSETILRGFSALFGAVGASDPAKASRYVRQVIEHNPQIFALEVVQTVANNRLSDFVATKRHNGFPDFSVKSFSYDSDRKWQALDKNKPFYYPIVFMEPMPPGSEDVLGLDVDSVPFLQKAMNKSLQLRMSVASHPFRLVEGNLAYVVFYPIPKAFQRNSSPPAPTAMDELMVDMVIDAAQLTAPAKFPVAEGEKVYVYHQDFKPDDPKGQLMAMSGKSRSPIETVLFPAFTYKKQLATMGNPFSLMVKRQVGWSDLSLGFLTLIGILTVLSSLTLVAYLRAHKQSRFLQIDNQNRLWQLANHDALTGLPNRMLLMDRMEQLLARMQRQGKRLAVMFLDLDDFKQINDSYGHEVGDQLLKLVADRLRTSIRQEDTVARMSGDEFIILIEGVESLDALEAVSEKIQEKLSDGFQVNSLSLSVRTSTGIATFPEDGDNPDALIKQADMRMYADKQARSKKLHLV
jgi:diguanylate cyclase (GGDEF)-like protein